MLDEKLKNIGGESNVEVRTRMFEILSEVLQKYKGKRVAIVSHGGAIKFLLMKWCNYDYETDSIRWNGKLICSAKLESPSVLKLVFEGNAVIEIVKIC